MANEEHVKILKQGAETWNKWREENRDVRPDLSSADLSEANLFRASAFTSADKGMSATTSPKGHGSNAGSPSGNGDSRTGNESMSSKV